MEKRSIDFLVILDDFFPKILEWNLIAWKLWQKSKGNEKRNEWIGWFELSRILSSIITKTGERAIEEKQDLFSMFFLKHFQAHVEAHKEEQILVGNRRRYYVKDLFRIFLQLAFEKVSSSDESYEFWKAFPNEWKVTKSNLIGEKSLIPKILLNEFMEWARPRIWSNTSSDLQLNVVSCELFPELNPRVWAIVLIFVLSPYDPENRVKSVIDRSWGFGYSLRPTVFFGEKPIEEMIETQKLQEKTEIQKAYEMTLLIFPDIFSEELLKTYVQQANELEYSDKPAENSKKTKILEVFLGLLQAVKKE
jgi:hypothetical protein